MTMYDSTHEIDLAALRAERAEAIVNGEVPDDAGWLDDWGGTHTLDDGHPGSYAHEAVAATDSVTVTLTCQCGAWAGSAPADTDEAPGGLFGEWELHVYKATGRWQADNERDEVREHPGEVEQLRAELDARDADNVALSAEVERLAERNTNLKVDLLGAEAQCNRLRESLRGEQFILWGEIALAEAKANAQYGRRLKSKLHNDPQVSATWDAFRDALDASIEATGEAL